MNLKKKCLVMMVETNDNTIIKKNLSDKLLFKNFIATATQNQHLHIVSDDEIKEGDLVFCNLRVQIVDTLDIENNTVNFVNPIYNGYISACKKIIATTDKSLTHFAPHMDCNGLGCDDCLKHSLPEPSPQFIQKFIDEYNKGNIIKEVNVDFIFNTTNEDWSKTPVQLDGYYTPKIDKNNFITITKIKESWDRLEMIEKLKSFAHEFVANTDTAYKQAEIDKWIEENL